MLKNCYSPRAPNKSLLTSLLGKYHLSGVHAVQWGIQHKAPAIAKNEASADRTVQPSGLWLSTSGLVGGSPDGIVDGDTLIEVKYPYSACSTSLQTLCQTGKSFFLSFADGQYSLNMGSDMGLKYFHQVQGNLCLTGRKYCDFIVWTPAQTVVFRVSADSSWSENIKKLEDFYKKHYLHVFLEGGV